MQCMMGAQAKICRSGQAYPRWVAKRWSCRPAGRIRQSRLLKYTVQRRAPAVFEHMAFSDTRRQRLELRRAAEQGHLERYSLTGSLPTTIFASAAMLPSHAEKSSRYRCKR